ncbi:MAG: RNase H1/viroplasmin domain-containing protein, partial [Lachnospiraceae bacterium]|nr:RNase H1/viroplasmin domain-containing protein [Lachnospiraceae bacterium]
MAKKIYAVRKGRKTGLFYSWEDCRAQVHGYSGPEYKGFTDIEEAKAFLGWPAGMPAEEKTAFPGCPASVTADEETAVA